MIRAFVFCLSSCLCLAGTAWAQAQVATDNAGIAQLRALDTLTGAVTDIDATVGETHSYERLMITVQECRYPKGNPNGDAFALLTIKDIREEKPRFDAWMVASSPALSALEHPRYDVWLLKCKTSEG
ncbi:DUF2155 domain-containing protein [Amylibacter sp. SFDW26]|uniref:DUF2155 domain-containing protein n=1 Tax=Amylibacter sp. SFDW26 TaxID=2652722 RepID=UPI0012616D40|nr:DUF2155 domain-containing protein [Amylibacter sp. SFDW26]KAB7615718.1 DUF2155 domain-containing protein [Amylibacter sp. SFDW26]